MNVKKFHEFGSKDLMINIRKQCKIILEKVEDAMSIAMEKDMELEQVFDTMGLEYNTFKNAKGFLKNSLVMTPEDDPCDLCYFSPDGNMLVSTNGPLDESDLDDVGYYDFKTFMEYYDGYDGAISVKI